MGSNPRCRPVKDIGWIKARRRCDVQRHGPNSEVPNSLTLYQNIFAFFIQNGGVQCYPPARQAASSTL